MSKIAAYLNQYITGAAYGESAVLDAYATDRSILKIRPRIVAVPRTASDVRRLVRFANQLAAKNIRLPVTVRGAGTSKTGAAIGSGMILSMEAMNNIQEIDVRQRLIRVQAGVTLGQLNSALALHGLTLPISADPKRTIGGLIATGCARRAGDVERKTIADFVNQIEVVLSSGDLIQTEQLQYRRVSKKQGIDSFEGDIYRKITALFDDRAEDIVSSENLVGYASLPEAQSKNKSLDLSPIFFGSEGTLGIITEVILSCTVIAEPPQYYIVACPGANSTIDTVGRILPFGPSSIDIYDISLLNEAAGRGKKFRPISDLPKNGVLVVATFDDPQKRRRIKKIKQLTKNIDSRYQQAVSTPENYEDFVELQSILSVYLNGHPRTRRVPIADGALVPIEQIKRYFAGIAKLEEKYQISIPVFGSALANTYSVRPEIDLGSVAGRQFVLAFLRDYDRLIDLCRGSLAGDTPEGRVKAAYTNEHLDKNTAKLYGEVKNIFDPDHILNPEVKQSATLRTVVRQLRTSYNLGIIAE